MAVGQVKISSNAIRWTKLIENVSANMAAPSLATDGVPGYTSNLSGSGTPTADAGVNYVGRPSREATIAIKGTAAGGTIAATFRLWGYVANLGGGTWVPLGTGSDSTKGTLNNGASMGATAANTVLHAEPVYLAGHFDRLYLQLTGIGGTTPSFDAWIGVPRTVQF